jgi:hypothetical protein
MVMTVKHVAGSRAGASATRIGWSHETRFIGNKFMFLELFPFVASAIAALCFLAMAAEES